MSRETSKGVPRSGGGLSAPTRPLLHTRRFLTSRLTPPGRALSRRDPTEPRGEPGATGCRAGKREPRAYSLLVEAPGVEPPLRSNQNLCSDADLSLQHRDMKRVPPPVSFRHDPSRSISLPTVMAKHAAKQTRTAPEFSRRSVYTSVTPTAYTPPHVGADRRARGTRRPARRRLHTEREARPSEHEDCSWTA